MKEEREDNKKQEKQLTEMMHSLVVVAQQEEMKHEILMKEPELQHAKEIEEIRKSSCRPSEVRRGGVQDDDGRDSNAKGEKARK